MNYSRKPLLFTVLAIVAIGIPRVAHADASSPSSTLAAGDWWKYDFQVTIVGLTLTGPITETLVAQQSISVQGIYYDSYRITLTGSGSVSGIIAGYTATRVVDYLRRRLCAHLRPGRYQEPSVVPNIATSTGIGVLFIDGHGLEPPN